MDIESQGVHSPTSPPAAAWPAPQARPVMPVVSVEDRLRRRHLRTFSGRLAMVLLDALMINVGFLGAYYLRYTLLEGLTLGPSAYAEFPLSEFLPLEVVTTLGLLVAFYMRGLYRLRPTGTWFKQMTVVVSSTTMAFAFFAAYEFLVRSTELVVLQTRLLVALTWGAVIIAVCVTRFTVGLALGWLYRRGIGLTNIVVIGSGRLAKLLMQHVAASAHLGYHVVGFVQDMDGPAADFGRFKAVGTMDDLDGVIRANRVEEVVIALPSHQHHQILRAVRLCERAGADFKLVPDMYEMSLSRIDVDAVEGIPLIGLRRTLSSSRQRTLKRLLDIIIALAVLVIGSPLWLIIALAIKLDSPGPVLYAQTRLGYRGQPFDFLKFRSMHVNADKLLEDLRTRQNERGVIFKDRNDPRRTRVGSFLRKTSLDEIPNFINVLRGEMSVVGPRPPLPSEFENYEDWEKARLEATPGITGVWQVRGRSDIDFDEMVLMDLYYIENWSLRLDIQLILRTIPAVLFRRGAY